MLKYIISHNSFVSNSKKYLLEIERLSRVMSVNAVEIEIMSTLSRDSYLKKRLSFTINKEY